MRTVFRQMMGVFAQLERGMVTVGLTWLTDIHPSGAQPGKDVHHWRPWEGRSAPVGSFSKQFKAEVVDLVSQPGNNPASVARDLTETAVRAWMR